MCTVKELKEFLDTLPDETPVDVLKVYEGFYSSSAKFEPLDLSSGVYVGSKSERFPFGYLELGEE